MIASFIDSDHEILYFTVSLFICLVAFLCKFTKNTIRKLEIFSENRKIAMFSSRSVFFPFFYLCKLNTRKETITKLAKKDILLHFNI